MFDAPIVVAIHFLALLVPLPLKKKTELKTCLKYCWLRPVENYYKTHRARYIALFFSFSLSANFI